MKIVSLHIKEDIKKKPYGLNEINMSNLGDVVILTGSNGSGKSRLFKLIEKSFLYNNKKVSNIALLEKEENIINNTEIMISDGNNTYALNDIVKQMSIINYSHYDAKFQSPKDFAPYVIALSKEKLKKCDLEETVQNGLLYITYLAKYAEDDHKEFNKFNDLLYELLNVRIELDDNNNPQLYGFNIYESHLSPGQQYLLRMCIALYCNEIKNDNFILLLDEPETHLHPSVLWEMINKIKIVYGKGQIWIATHSVALLSMFDPSDIWHIDSGCSKKLGSKSEPLIRSLVGNEERRLKLREFIVSPDNFACNTFAVECMEIQDSVNYKKDDPQIKIAVDKISENNKPENLKKIIIDYGAGKGRLIDGIATDYPEKLTDIDYYAYDAFDNDAETCMQVMEKFCINKDNYFNKWKELKESISNEGKADFVLMVNVLHEIDPIYWTGIFNDIYDILADNGNLIIVEHEELTYGEKPYNNGFLVIQEEALKLLSSEKILCNRCSYNDTIAGYTIPRSVLNGASEQVIEQMVEKIGNIALKKIKEIKSYKQDDNSDLFKPGIRLAFWTHQFANSQLILNKKQK